MAKYGNHKCVLEGISFDSVREARRWKELRLMEKAGLITDLKRQVTFVLIPSQEGQRPVKYIADFTYVENGMLIVEDAKGVKTKDYIIKKKLMQWVHGLKIREV